MSASRQNVRESGSLPDPDEPDHENGWSEDGGLDLKVTDTTKTVPHDVFPNGDSGPRLHAIHVTVENDYEGEQDWERTEKTCTGSGENKTCDTNTYTDETSKKTFEPALDASINQLITGVSASNVNRDVKGIIADIGNSSLLSDNIRCEIDASPTYLSRSPITQATTPEVRPSYAGVEDPENADHASLAVRNNAWLSVPGLPVVP